MRKRPVWPYLWGGSAQPAVCLRRANDGEAEAGDDDAVADDDDVDAGDDDDAVVEAEADVDAEGDGDAAMHLCHMLQRPRVDARPAPRQASEV